MVFLKDFFPKKDFEKNINRQENHEKLLSVHKVEGPIAIAADNKSFLNLAGLSCARKVALPCFVFKLFPLNEAVPHKTCTPAQMPHLFYWKIIQCLTSHFGVKDQLDRMFDLKIYVVHCDLNVMVH